MWIQSRGFSPLNVQVQVVDSNLAQFNSVLGSIKHMFPAPGREGQQPKASAHCQKDKGLLCPAGWPLDYIASDNIPLFMGEPLLALALL